MGKQVLGNITYSSGSITYVLHCSNNSDLQQTTVTTTHVDQKHHVTHVTLDRLTKVTAMTSVFSAAPRSRVLLCTW